MAVGREMRSCTAPLLQDRPSIREFAAVLGIDKSLAWQVRHIAAATDPVAILIALPGRAGMSKAMRALKGAGRDTAALEASRAMLVYVLNRRGISRAQLKSMATGILDGDAESGALRQLHRRAYEANSAVQGRAIGGIAVAVMLMPAGSADRMTLVAATMLHRMVRTVMSGPIPIYYRTQAAGAPVRAGRADRTSAAHEPSGKGSMASLVRHLCSPEVEDDHLSIRQFRSGEALCYDPPPSCVNRVDFAFREVGHGVGTLDRGRARAQGSTDVAIFNPAGHAVIDLMLHRSLHAEDLSVSLSLRNAPEEVCKSAPEFLKHPMPIEGAWVSRRVLPAPFVAAGDRWEALVEGSARAVEASISDFRTFRVEIEYPPTPSTVHFRWAWGAGGPQ